MTELTKIGLLDLGLLFHAVGSLRQGEEGELYQQEICRLMILKDLKEI